MWYKVRWTKRDGGNESRTTRSIDEATALKNFLLEKNVLNVDLAVIIGDKISNNTSAMFPAKKYQFKKMP